MGDQEEEVAVDSQTSLIAGIMLIAVGVLDPLVGLLVVAPRFPDVARRRMVAAAFLASAVVLIGLGAAFLGGVFK
jgi:UPF0716 family protein affecting phage T7 exclusion